MSRDIRKKYRKRVHAGDLVSFRVEVKETDLLVSADKNMEEETRNLVFECRYTLESYIKAHPEFETSLTPLDEDPFAPPMIKEMIDVTRNLGVGPMASVAGAIAEYVAMGLLKLADQVIIENGGDIFLKTARSATVSIFAGDSPLSEKLGILIPKKQMPLSVCSSSASVGHSLSMGISDVACVVSPSGSLSDGAATAIGNSIRDKSDLAGVAERVRHIKGITGGVLIVEDRMATWGDIELVEL